MRIIIFILSIFSFVQTVSYGIYEYKQNNNKVSSIIIYVLAVIALIAPNVMIFIR